MSKGKMFKIQYKHYGLRHERDMVVPISSKANETMLIVSSLGRTLKIIRWMIGFLNPPKEEKETLIRKTKNIKKLLAQEIQGSGKMKGGRRKPCTPRFRRL